MPGLMMKSDPALEGDDDRADLDCTKLTRLMTIVIDATRRP
jgi:hypothetical protein